MRAPGCANIPGPGFWETPASLKHGVPGASIPQRRADPMDHPYSKRYTMAKSGKRMLKFAILMVALVSQINTIASVMLTDLAVTFPDASDTVIQYVMQMGMVGAFIISFALTFLTNFFKRRTLVLFGLILIMVGGIVPIFLHSSIYLLWFFAFLVGAGQGILLPTLGALILDNFEGDERNQMLGLNTAFYNAAAAALLVVAGFLCTSGWINVYYCYFIVIPVFVIAILFLSPEEKRAEQPADGSAPAKKRGGVPVKGLIQCLLNVVLMIGYAVFPLNLSLYVVRDAAIADASAVGIAMSLVTIVAALVSLILPQVVKVVKLYIGFIAAAFGLLANVLVMFASDITLIYVAAVADGVFFGLLMAGAGYLVGRICTPEEYGPTYALSTSFVSLGTIFCPIVVNFISGIWGGDIANAGTAFVTAIGVFAVATVIQFVWASYLTKTLPPEEAPAAQE